ncbi:MAG: NADH-quinone oxidoreductase subunit C [Cyclobacteriaceae bacterium]
MTPDTVKKIIEENFPEAILGEDPESTPLALTISGSRIVELCEFLHSNEQCYFDQLACLTGIDCGEESGKMEVVYNLYSIPFDFQLMLKVELERNNPVIQTVSTIWRAADWHEREAYDLLGIQFEGHPDLRRILMPDDWEGHPLRKDYVEQEKYHGIQVKWKAENE